MKLVADDFFFTPDGSEYEHIGCFAECQEGSFWDDGLNACVGCDAGCATCSEAGSCDTECSAECDDCAGDACLECSGAKLIN